MESSSAYSLGMCSPLVRLAIQSDGKTIFQGGQPTLKPLSSSFGFYEKTRCSLVKKAGNTQGPQIG